MFHAEMGTIKDRNGMDLTEAEDIIELSHKVVGRFHEQETESDRERKRA